MKADVERSLLDLQGTQAGVRARFCFPPELEVFTGHFPGRPLVPGVLLIEAARLACSRVHAAPLGIARVAKAKFTGEVLPGAEVELDATLGADLSCRATLSVGDAPVAKLKLILKEVSCSASS